MCVVIHRDENGSYVIDHLLKYCRLKRCYANGIGFCITKIVTDLVICVWNRPGRIVDVTINYTSPGKRKHMCHHWIPVSWIIIGSSSTWQSPQSKGLNRTKILTSIRWTLDYRCSKSYLLDTMELLSNCGLCEQSMHWIISLGTPYWFSYSKRVISSFFETVLLQLSTLGFIRLCDGLTR